MLKDNIRTIRKTKGLSQEELAVKLNVVRQTVSKWENGLSVPDSDLLIELSGVLETPVSVLLGENVPDSGTDDVKAIAAKLEVINAQLARRRISGRNAVRWVLGGLIACIIITGAVLYFLGSPYLSWDYSDPQTAVLGTAAHAFEWAFFRIAPFCLIAAAAGIAATFRRKG